MKNWRALTSDELAGLSEGDPVVLRLSSRDAFQWNSRQRDPEVITYTGAKYVEKSKRGQGVLVLKEGTDQTVWVAGVEVGRYED